ncbi:MAG: hypothetical protein ACOCWQ_02030 [Nanoarchaeota archaeon]
MVQKTSYDFAAKQLYRDTYRKFLASSLAHIPASQRRVLCFPGHEGLEITEVYDPLGIPRANIVALEQSPDIAETIRNQFPDITVITQDAYDYFQESHGEFHAINLDYQGQLKQPEMLTLRKLLMNRSVANGGVLATNFFGNREPAQRQKQYAILANQAQVDLENIANFHAHMTGTRPNFAMNDKSESLPEVRDKGISADIVNAIGVSGSNTFYQPFLDSAKKTMIDIAEHMCPGITEKVPLQDLPLEVPGVGIAIGSTFVAEMQRANIAPGYASQQYYNIFTHLQMSHDKPYIIADHKRYAYPSGRNLMLADFVQLNTQWHRWDMDLVRFDIEGTKITARRGYDKPGRKLTRFIETVARKYLPAHFAPRIMLSPEGNLAVPAPTAVDGNTTNNTIESSPETPPTGHQPAHSEPRTGPEITKAEIRDLLRDGIPLDEILEAFDHQLTRMEAAAFRAHQTRGTYSTP